MRYRATVAYDGTGYYGFQRQANAAPTIQGTLEAALSHISGRQVGVVGAGRTDAGVHAVGQVIAFDLDWRHSEVDLRNALNANLPDDIAVLAVQEAAPDFHPRYAALKRSYLYRLYVAPVRDPLRRRTAWHLTTEVDVDAMQAAADCLIGTHDFSAFGSPPQGSNAVRTVYEACWKSDGEGQFTFTITANAFLYQMVRHIVGTLVAVGQGRMTGKMFRGILADRARDRVEPPAPPHGLTLVAVHYRE